MRNRIALCSLLLATPLLAQEGRPPEPPRPPPSGDAERRPGPDFRGREGFRPGGGGDDLDFLRLLEESPEAREKIALTEEQRERLLQLRERSRNALPEMRERQEQARRTYMELLAKPEAQEEALLNALDALLAAEGDLRKAALRVRLQARKALTAEQLATLQSMQRDRRPPVQLPEGRRGGRPEGDRPLPPPGERRDGPRPDAPRRE
jgi:Spy/CpxP family protein refolding chaperone